MAKRRSGRAADEAGAEASAGVTGGPPAAGAFPTGPETTGRYMVIFKPGARDTRSVRGALNDLAGLKDIAGTSDYESAAFAAGDLADSDTVHFEQSGVARVSEEAVFALATSVASDAASPILAIEPELVAYPAMFVPPGGYAPAAPAPLPPAGLGLVPGAGFPGLPVLPPAALQNMGEYLRGFGEAVAFLTSRLGGAGGGQFAPGPFPGALVPPVAAPAAAAGFFDTAQLTWGLQATRAHTSPFTGQGVKVAVLDTGFDLAHPDFAGRAVTHQTFTGVPVQDHPVGHGTHCVGTALGPKAPASGARRYGVAHAAQVFVGRVFNAAARPTATTSAVVAGIEWARANGCQIVSLSLGADVNQQFLQYQIPIQLALDNGCLVIAAAGNNANRPGLPGFDPFRPATVGFVTPPANADAAMAVGAVDHLSRIAVFSARSSTVGANGQAGLVNVAGPGVGVFSCVPGGHGFMDGTSMATPHVAGIAALWCQATGKTGQDLWTILTQNVTPLDVPSADVGAGMVRAPQA